MKLKAMYTEPEHRPYSGLHKNVTGGSAYGNR